MRGPRRRRRRQPAASRGSETDGDGLVEQHPLDAEIEVLAAAEPDGGADDVAGELPQGGVELVDGEVEEAPRGGDAVLGVGELDPEIAEMHRSLQLGVALDDGQERSDALADLRFGLEPRVRARGAERVRPRPRHLRQHRQLMAGVAAHGLDETWDEIVAMLQLDVDVRKGRRAALAEAITSPNPCVSGFD